MSEKGFKVVTDLPVRSDEKSFYKLNYREFYIDYTSHTQENYQTVFLHRHDTGEFLLVESGASIVSIGDSVRRIEAPYLIYAPPYQLHEQINDCSNTYSRYCFSVDPSYFNGDMPPLPDNLIALKLDGEEFARLNGYVSLLCGYYHSKKTEYSALEFSRRKLLLTLFINELTPMLSDRIPEPKLTRRYINQVCAYINEHFSEKLSLDFLAELFFVSRAKLTSDFRLALKMSVCDYIAAVRTSRSKVLLRGGIPLSEIACRCGFSNSAYYSKVFERINGITPAKFRMEQMI